MTNQTKIQARNTTRCAAVTFNRNERSSSPEYAVNPYANRLTFLDDKTRMRRDHMKYLTLIQAITLLHQHQRPVRSVEHRGQRLEYIEVTKDDIALANHIAHEVLGRTLDELPPQTRRMLTLLQAWVAERCTALNMQRDEFRFTRKQVREMTRWGDTQLKLYFARLVELEYLIAHYNGRRQATEYELMYDGCGDDQPHLMGLLDPAELDQAPDNKNEWSDKNSEWSASGRGAVGMQSGCGRIEQTQVTRGAEADSPEIAPKARIRGNGKVSPVVAVVV